VLVNVPKPEEIVREMVRLTRPGGCVAFHEPINNTQRVYPPHPAQDQLLDLLRRYAMLNGIDRDIGQRVPGLVRDAGVRELQVTPLVYVYPVEHSRRYLILEFVENLRERVLEKNLISATELAALTSALRAHLDLPATLVVSNIFLQVCGRVPE
jgi:hypothetical protein